jgi:hypothetical protein
LRTKSKISVEHFNLIFRLKYVAAEVPNAGRTLKRKGEKQNDEKLNAKPDDRSQQCQENTDHIDHTVRNIEFAEDLIRSTTMKNET